MTPDAIPDAMSVAADALLQAGVEPRYAVQLEDGRLMTPWGGFGDKSSTTAVHPTPEGAQRALEKYAAKQKHEPARVVMYFEVATTPSGLGSYSPSEPAPPAPWTSEHRAETRQEVRAAVEHCMPHPSTHIQTSTRDDKGRRYFFLSVSTYSTDDWSARQAALLGAVNALFRMGFDPTVTSRGEVPSPRHFEGSWGRFEITWRLNP